ncbi:MAG: hypothetical protein VB046_07945 [Paludibacter sp.]|nr:hypothetical protein [Paludibacter sp.]
MKTKTLFLSFFLFLSFIAVANNQEELNFTTIGSCASYLKWYNPTSQDDFGTYEIVRTTSPIVVDAVAEEAWSAANAEPIARIAHYTGDGGVLNLSNYPQTEAYAYAVYRALWTDDGVYMYISVKDEYVRYTDTGWQWENDAIEFYFSKDRGEGKIQIIIPAMVGMTDPSKNYPEPLAFESGSAVGSHPDYKVFGYDSENWDESLFFWAIRKTSDGWDMEVYMDKDIVTNGNSSTHYALDEIFAGDINYDFAGLKQNGSKYGREGTLALLGNSNQEYAGSNDYGYFKLVNGNSAVNSPKDANFKAMYSPESREINIMTEYSIASTSIYNVAGQVMLTTNNKSVIPVGHLQQGVYIVKSKDLSGNILGIKKVTIY